MDVAANHQLLIIGSLIALLVVSLIARHFSRNAHSAHGRFGDDHSQAIAEMGMRTRAEAQRKERERLDATQPNLSH